MERYADRFDAKRYSDDPPVRLFLVESVGVEDEFWLPERLWGRLQRIASAYELHLLPVLGWSDEPQFLNAQQCLGLLDELEFVANQVDDSPLDTVVEGIVRQARKAQGASKNALGIEFT
jgi:hypothetical protein